MKKDKLHHDKFISSMDDIIIFDENKKCVHNGPYYKKLSNIFSDSFIAPNKKADYWDQKECEFNCENSEICNVKNDTPKYTSWVGDIETKIMVIGEAPSGKCENGKGVIGGYFENSSESKKSPLYAIREFFIKNYNEIPYFTDLCKCGVSKQTNKIDLKNRFETCFEKFLIKEIEAIKPEKIFVLGNNIKSMLLKNRTRIEKAAGKEIKIIKLMHYSKRASLPLNIEDKINIIWRYQDGRDYDVTKLSFFK